jgi:hypothetical protein
MNRNTVSSLLAFVLVILFSVPVLADTIRLKNGTVIHGQVIGFRDQQFTVLLDAGSRGRRSRMQIYMEDIDSIEFDSTGATNAAGGSTSPTFNDNTGSTDTTVASEPTPQPTPRPTAPRTNTTQGSQTTVTSSTSAQPSSRTSPRFFQINARVRADNTSNGWTNTGLVVRRGQRLRISATGRVSLGAGRSSTPAGIPTLPDRDKLMRNDPTGGLIAVIGDDNDDFIFVGSSRDFIAQRDGVLFLGVNEGNLADNTGAYDAVIEAEAMGR